MRTQLFLSMAVAVSAYAQVDVSGGAYFQDFNSLENTASVQAFFPWVDNTTIPGWYKYQSGSSSANYIVTDGGAKYQIASYGLYGNSDRALGSGNDNNNGPVHFGVALRNTTGSTSNVFTVDFDGEQWGGSLNGFIKPDSLVFSYQIFTSGAGALSVDSGWVTVSALELVSPNPNYGSAPDTPPDGNDSLNSTHLSASFTTDPLLNGQELWLRWTATNLPDRIDHDLAIDNLTVVFGTIPEPSTYAIYMGASALFFLAYRRARR